MMWGLYSFVRRTPEYFRKDESGILVNTTSFLITAGEVTAAPEEPRDRRRLSLAAPAPGLAVRLAAREEKKKRRSQER